MIIQLTVFSMLLGSAHATVTEKVKDVVEDVKVGAKAAVRKVKDEACTVVDGETKCAPKKAKHKVQNAVDELKK